MITWKQEGSTWVGYIGERKVFEIKKGRHLPKKKYLHFVGMCLNVFDYEHKAKQAAEDFAAEMKQLFNTTK